MIRGEVWWADLGLPLGSEPGFKRPVLIIQDNSFNRSRIQTVIVASITSNSALGEAPGNVYLNKEESGLPKDGVINISQISTIDKRRLLEKVGVLTRLTISEVNIGLEMILNL